MVKLCKLICTAAGYLWLDTLYLGAALLRLLCRLSSVKFYNRYDKRVNTTKLYMSAVSAADAWQYIYESDLKNFGIHDDQSERDCITD